eukprot:3919156-Amphidinium_carterae.1
MSFDAVAVQMREKLRLQWSLVPATGPTGYETDLVQELVRRGGDPEQDLAQWMAGSTPLGISVPIPPRG